MLGAIIGDIVGSRFEWHNIKSKEFDLFTSDCRLTDDSVMTLAVAQALLDCDHDYRMLSEKAIFAMQTIGRKYPNCGFGGNFLWWVLGDSPEPYNSYGNGAAMRVSPCAYAASSLEEVVELSRKVTEVSHNHPEGIKGAEATAVATYMARTGRTIPEIKQYINDSYYPMDFTLDGIRASYTFDVSCQGSVPQAIMAFLESDSFEDAIRNAVSIGGDSDTIAAITGSIAGAFYGVPQHIKLQAMSYMDKLQVDILTKFEDFFAIG